MKPQIVTTLNKYYQKAKPLIRNNENIVLFAAGIVAGYVYAFSTYELVLILTLCPFMFLFTSKRTYSIREGSVAAASFFIPFHALVIWWFLDADISGLVHISSHTAAIASYLSLVIMSLVMTICMFPLAVLLACKNRFRKYRLLFLLGLLPATWIVSEYARSIGFGAFLYGHGGSIGDYWNFGSIGLALINTGLMPLSKFVGMYGLSFIAVLFAVLIVIVVSRSPRKSMLVGAVVCLCAVLLLCSASRLVWHDTGSTLKEASIMQVEGQSPELNSLHDLTGGGRPTKKDVIVLPEYSEMFEPRLTKYADKYINSRLQSDGFSVNVSSGTNVKPYGTLEFRNNKGSITATQTKELLIPTGEYLPFLLATFYKLTGQEHIVTKFNITRGRERGNRPQVFTGENQLTIGPIACSGILGRSIYRNLSNSGAGVLTNSANLSIFNNSQSYFRQSLMMAKFHAVANNRVFIQASAAAPAFVIDTDGSYIVPPSQLQTTFKDFAFPVYSAKTIYTILGEWVLYLSAVITIIGIIYAFMNGIKAN